MPLPYLEIIEQPLQPFRFRYKSEMHGTHGSLMGIGTERSKKTYPTVALRNFGYASKAMIRCSLYQVPSDTQPNRSPHSHQLISRHNDTETSDPHDREVSSENDFTAV
jgi:nuclear factor NF-kappa-B p105 subunit